MCVVCIGFSKFAIILSIKFSLIASVAANCERLQLNQHTHTMYLFILIGNFFITRDANQGSQCDNILMAKVPVPCGTAPVSAKGGSGAKIKLINN